MRVLGISASYRKWGNTDLLVHSALLGARADGAETRFLRLTDLSLAPCTGCMACVFKGRDCVQQDRLHELLQAMRDADALVLGSPAYVLGATAAVKNLHDRMIRFGVEREFKGKPGMAMVAAGVSGWEPFSLPQVSMFLLFLGMPVVDQFVGYAQGPGEILEDEEVLQRARRGGGALARGETAYRGATGACPVCHFDLVTPARDGRARCTLCDLAGTWTATEGSGRLEPDPGARPRWSDAAMGHHFQKVVLPSGPRFRDKLREVRARVEAFREELEA